MSSEKHLSNQRFTELPLAEPLQAAVRGAGFEWLTPIQAETLPILLDGEDVAGQAQTGTGKTACFLLALFDYLLRTPARLDREPTQVRAVVLAPTRELAIQIHRDAEPMAAATGFRLALAYGGTGYEQQRRVLQEGADVLIGTPGRIIDYYKQKVFGLGAVQVMVLDEADRMFDLGFIKDIRFLLRRMPAPEERLNMLFSATLSLRVNELAYEHMNNPRVVRIDSKQVTVAAVRERVYFPGNDDKIPLLVGLLRSLEPGRAMVFVNTRHMAEKLELWLNANGRPCAVLSGDVPQLKRERLLAAFKNGEMGVLVATDVAARGLHISDVTHVFNFDLPQDPEDYVHRIGRTARAGASGEAVSFACENYAESLPDIESYIGHRIEPENIEPGILAELEAPSRAARQASREERDRGPRGEAARGRGRGRSSEGSDRTRRRPRDEDSGRGAPAVAAVQSDSADFERPAETPEAVAPTPLATVVEATDAVSASPPVDGLYAVTSGAEGEDTRIVEADGGESGDGEAPRKRRRRRRKRGGGEAIAASDAEPEAEFGVEQDVERSDDVAAAAAAAEGEGETAAPGADRRRRVRQAAESSDEEPSAPAPRAEPEPARPRERSIERPEPVRTRRRFPETPAIG